MTEIGKVSVRVIPDTRGFASKAKRDLKRLKDLSFKVDVELNERQFNAQVKRLIAKTNSELMKPENHIKFRASLEASNRQLSSEVRDVRRRMQAMADEEKIEFKSELDKKLGKKGKGGLLQLDPKGAVKELKRELGGERYELPVFANTDGVQKDLRRMARSSRYKIDVDLMVDRKKIYDDVDSITELLSTAVDAMKRTDALKFQIDVDKASVKKWTTSVKEVEASLKEQRKVYQDTQRELQIVKDRAADYAGVVSESTKAITKLKAQQKADAQREADLTEELLEVRRVIAKSAGDVTEETIREKRLVDQIEKMRRDAFELSAKRAEAEAKAMQEIKDASREIAKLEERRAKLKEQGIATGGQIEKLEIDHKKLQAELDRARNKLEMDAIELDVNLDQASTEAVAARLAVLARDRIVTIFTRIQKNSLDKFEKRLGTISDHSKDLGNNVVKWVGQLAGVRVMWRSFRDMVDWLPKLDMMVPELARNFSLLTTAVTGAVGALGMGFTLLSDIGSTGKAILALPAAFAALGLQFAILQKAYVDYENKVPQIAADLETMITAAGDAVWDKAIDNIEALHAVLMPLLDLYMPAWGSALGDNVGALADGFAKATKDGVVDQFFKNAIKGSKNAKTGFEALGDALLRLTGAGSEVLPDIGTWFSETMADFDNWVTKHSKNGNIEKWIREAGTALRELGSIGVSTVKIVAGVADAFNKAGWPGLTELEAGMRSLAESALALKDNDSFMQPLEQMHDFFAEFTKLGPQAELAMKNFWGMIGDSAEVMAKPLADALGYILDGFNSAKFQNGFGKFITGIASFVDDVGPGIGAMTEEIGSLLGVVGTAAESWGPAYNDMLLLFASSGDLLHPGLLDFVENLGPRLQDLITDITPHVEDFSRALGDLLGNENFQQLVGDLINDLGDLAGALLDLGTWVVDVAGKFSDWYGGLGEGQQDFVRWTGLIVGFAGGALTLLGGALIKVTGFFRKLGGALKFLKLDKLLAPLKKIKLGPFLTGLADDIALRAMYAWDKIKGIGKKLGDVLRGIGKAIVNGAKAAGKGIANGAKWVGGVLRSFADDIALRAMYLWDKVKSIATRAGNALRNLGGAIGRAASGLVSKLKGVGRAVGNAFRNLAGKIKLPTLKGIGGGLSKLLSPLVDFVKKIPGQLAKLLPKGGLLKMVGKALTRFIPVVGWVLLARDLLNLIKPVGVLEWVEGILRGLGLDGVADIIGGVKDNIAKVFGSDVGLADLFSPLFNALRKAWDGAVAGWKEDGLWGAIKGFFSGFADGLTDSFQLLWENIKSAVNWGIDWINTQLASWNPTSEAGKFMKDLIERIPGLLGLNADGSFSWDTLTSSWAEFGSELWTNYIKPWLEDSWTKLVNWARQWEPLDQVMGFFEDPWGKIQEWLGITELVTGVTSFLADPVEWGSNLWSETIQPWLTTSWDNLVAAVAGWAPVAAVIDFFEDPWGKIQEWLGIDGWDGGIPSIGEIVEWGTNLWNETVKPWLQDSWDKLVNFIKEWNPISLGFKLGTWIGDKVKEWLGFGENGLDFSSFSVDFDFTSLWENKIKPALTTGLLALAGLILAPGLVLIAPLALPPLIIGWLLGRDGEGNWSFQELTDKITGAWESIKGALTAGVDAIKGFVGTLVIAPIEMGVKIVDWLLGENWVESAKTGLTTAITNAGPALISGINAGVQAVETVANGGAGTAGAAAGGALRRVLGIDDEGKGRINLDFGLIGGWVKQFGGDTRSEYGTTATATGGSMDKMRDKTKGGFEDIKADAIRKMADMRSGVGKDFDTMKSNSGNKAESMKTDVVRKMEAMRSQGAAKTVDLQKEVIRALTTANTQGVKQASALNKGYVDALRAMSRSAISVAKAMKDSLIAVLTINASSPGRSTGNTFKSGLSGALNGAVSVARGIKDRIKGALNFSAYSSGASIGSSFASGLRAKISSVSSAASQLAAAARRKMPNSPADEGPFSGSGWGGWGESIAEELAKGLRKSAPEVAREAEKLMGGVNTALESRAEIPGARISPAVIGDAIGDMGAGASLVDSIPTTRLSDEDRALLRAIAEAANITIDGRSLGKAVDRSNALRGVF